MITTKLLLALLMDVLWGEPRRGHPLVGYGYLVSQVEALLRRGQQPSTQYIAGGLGWIILVLMPSVLLWWLLKLLSGGALILAEVSVLYFTLGNRSLAEHARAVALPLSKGDLERARAEVGMIVSRDTGALDEAGVASATVESVLENGSDAVMAPLFWFAVAGAPAALLYRLANTLDARWGYRSVPYQYFGRAAARLDDILNWVPARLCALSYSLVGSLPVALRCWRTQAPQAASPNAGPVMSAGAGALGIQIGGSAIYGGSKEPRPVLGCGPKAQTRDIARAVHLLWRATALWCLLMAFIEMLPFVWERVR